MNSVTFSLARLLAFLVVVSLAGRCAAQQGRFGIAFQQNRSRFISPPRSINQKLKDAEEAIAEERYSDAVVTLGDLLERDLDAADDPTVAGQDFFLEIQDSDQQRLDKSFLRFCRSLVGSLPDAALGTYELRYGALAQQLLEAATKTRDWKQLREVRRKYFHTKAGYQASLLLAQRELHLGHPLAASLLLDDVAASQNAMNELGDGMLVMHAVACRLAGRSLPRSLSLNKVTVQVGENGASESITDWRQWIDDHYTLPKIDSISRHAIIGCSVVTSHAMKRPTVSYRSRRHGGRWRRRRRRSRSNCYEISRKIWPPAADWCLPVGLRFGWAGNC